MENQQNQSFYYQRQLYIITAKTNLHVGSGEESFGLVDNRVQRDVVSDLPNINASGLKGALREHFSRLWGKCPEKITDIFGSDSFTQPEKHQAGKFRFFNANLLSLPVRSNARPFFRATSPEVIKEFIETLELFAFNDKFGFKDSLKQLLKKAPAKSSPLIFNGDKDVIFEESRFKATNIEFNNSNLEKIEKLTGKPLTFMDNNDFKNLCSDFNLPLIARNYLKNGKSENLWHEQVVPRESRFYFLVLKPADYKNGLEFKDDEPIQIGANASIGYGFCLISPADKLLEASESEENKP